MRRLKARASPKAPIQRGAPVQQAAPIQRGAPVQQAAPTQQGARVRPGADEGHVADGDVPVLQALVQQRVPEATQRPAVRHPVQQPLMTQ